MGVPSSANARLFYRCARQRIDEAEILQKALVTTAGAVYLAGYGIECILKALILNSLPQADQQAMIVSFKASGRGHDYEWLREQYRGRGGPRFPQATSRAFALVNDWSTELRYRPQNLKTAEIEAFLEAAKRIFAWADGRL